MLRVNITEIEYEYIENSYEDTVLVEYVRKSSDESRILEDDIITMYGTMNDLVTYESILGQSITIPSMTAKYVDIIE